jgi:hypothetical protein
MDRTSSSHNLRTTDTIQDNSINTNQTQDEKSSVIVSFGKQKQFTLPRTAFNNPQQPTKTDENINRIILGDEKINPYKDGKFHEIQSDTRPIYNALRNFEYSAYKYSVKYDKKNNDTELETAWSKFKIARDTLSRIENSPKTSDSSKTNESDVYLKKYNQVTSLLYKKEVDEMTENINQMELKIDRIEHQIAKGNTTLHNKRNKLNRELDKLINIKDHKEQIGLRTQTPLETYLADSHLRTKLDPLTGIFRDTKTGLYAELKPLGDGNFALCFGSTGVGRMMSKQIKVDIDQVLNQKKVPAAYTQAVDLAAELIKEVCLFGSEITVTGQSMGGGIANYVGLKLGIKSVCYNAAALGGAAIQDLQISTYKTENNIERACLDKDNINNQIQVRRNRDIFSGEKQQIKISQFANIFYDNVMTPQNIGPIFVAHDSDIPLQNGKPEGTKSRHRTSTFDAFYKQPIPKAITPPDNSDASSESSSASSPSGGEKS